MKFSVCLCFLFISHFFLLNKNKRNYDDGKFLYEFHIAVKNNKVKLKKGVRFYWYNYNEVKSSVYGVNGKVLNGKYTKTVLDSDEIVEKGRFIYGIKDGEWIKWFKGGGVNEIEPWKKGYRDGEYELYDKNSNLIISGKYKKVKKEGQWEENTFNKKNIKTWSKGVLNGKYEEYENGFLIKKGKYKKGLKSGIWINLVEKTTYKYEKGKLTDEKTKTFFERIFKKKKDSI
jgi:antitoxin component YwqK of YwqJK toxin-antitoxin module